MFTTMCACGMPRTLSSWHTMACSRSAARSMSSPGSCESTKCLNARGLSTPEGVLALRSISQRCAERIGDAARILEAQNEVLYAEERANAKPRENER